jgi:glucosamine 6-phosphate synthetase-like amidotransferase/phosphosugar isomerase protein
VGIGHAMGDARKPSEQNAHPHRSKVACSCTTASSKLSAAETAIGEREPKFHSETDTEVMAHQSIIISSRGIKLAEAVRAATRMCEGVMRSPSFRSGNRGR